MQVQIRTKVYGNLWVPPLKKAPENCWRQLVGVAKSAHWTYTHRACPWAVWSHTQLICSGKM